LLWDRLISFPFGVLLPLALVAVFAGKVRRNQFLLSMFAVTYSISLLLFFVNGRYRLPLVPILIIWAAVGIWTLIQLWKSREFARFYRLILLFLAALVVCNGLTYLPGLKVRPPTEYESHLHLGMAYHMQGEYWEARDQLETAARLYPRSPVVFTALGTTLEALGQDSTAAEAYKRAIAVDPEYERAVKRLASVYKRHNVVVPLNDLMLEQLDRTPNASWALKYYAWVHEAIDALDQACFLYEDAFRADTTDYDCLFQRARIFLERDLRGEAEAEYKRILKYLPNSVEAHANLGMIYARQNRIEAALREFQWVRDREPNDPTSYFNLASAYLQAGRLDLAERNLEQVVRLDPNFPAIDRLRQAIVNARQSEEE
jgi:tetratricopeptide (TPR) repeat protein